MKDYTVTFEWNIEANTPREAAGLVATLIGERMERNESLTFTVVAGDEEVTVDIGEEEPSDA